MFHTILMLTTLAAASTGGVETPTETISVNGPAGVEHVVISAFPTARTFIRGSVTSATTITTPAGLWTNYYTEYQILTEAGTTVYAVTYGGMTTPAQTDFPVGHVVTSRRGTHPNVGDEILAVAYPSADGVAGQFSYPWAGQGRYWFGVHEMLSLRAPTSTAAATGFFATAACVRMPSPALPSGPDIEAFESALVSAGLSQFIRSLLPQHATETLNNYILHETQVCLGFNLLPAMNKSEGRQRRQASQEGQR